MEISLENCIEIDKSKLDKYSASKKNYFIYLSNKSDVEKKKIKNKKLLDLKNLKKYNVIYECKIIKTNSKLFNIYSNLTNNNTKITEIIYTQKYKENYNSDNAIVNKEQDTTRICTYNVRGWPEGDLSWKSHANIDNYFDKINNIFVKIDADILVLQEVNFTNNLWNILQSDTNLKKYKYYSICSTYGTILNKSQILLCNLVLSKKELSDQIDMLYSNKINSSGKCVIDFKILINNLTINCNNVHLKSTSDIIEDNKISRELQLEKLFNILDKSKDNLILGDLNSSNHFDYDLLTYNLIKKSLKLNNRDDDLKFIDNVFNLVKKNNYYDALNILNKTSEVTSHWLKRLDYILLNKELSNKNLLINSGIYEQTVSDHLPVWADFKGELKNNWFNIIFTKKKINEMFIDNYKTIKNNKIIFKDNLVYKSAINIKKNIESDVYELSYYLPQHSSNWGKNNSNLFEFMINELLCSVFYRFFELNTLRFDLVLAEDNIYLKAINLNADAGKKYYNYQEGILNGSDVDNNIYYTQLAEDYIFHVIIKNLDFISEENTNYGLYFGRIFYQDVGAGGLYTTAHGKLFDENENTPEDIFQKKPNAIYGLLDPTFHISMTSTFYNPPRRLIVVKMIKLQKAKKYVDIRNSFKKLILFNEKLDILKEELLNIVEINFNGLTVEYSNFLNKKIIIQKMIEYFVLLIKKRIEIYINKGEDQFINELDALVSN